MIKEMTELMLVIMFSFCDYSPIVRDADFCALEIQQCYYDDAYTVEECIEEYKWDLENDNI